MKAFHCLVILGSLIQSLYTLRFSVAAILNPQWFSKHKGVFCEHFLLETTRRGTTWTQSHLYSSAVDLGCSPCCEVAWSACLGLLGGTLFGAWLLDYPSVCEGCLPFQIMVSHLVIIYLTSACVVKTWQFSSHWEDVCASDLWLWMRMSGTKNIPTPHFAFVKLSFHGCFPKRQFAYFIHC